MSKRRSTNYLIQAGIPLVTFLVGGSYFLSNFVETGLIVNDQTQGKSISTRKFNIEEEHRKIMNNLNIDEFTLSRIPRPEENSNSTPLTSKSSDISSEKRKIIDEIEK
mmetsp:Transcript_20438/g.18572  ORF Transcript_20438/g.18572 Transcript_20438/m.18572 type:complete len:108 (-) Transcript_20438:51-374(-)